jgi:SAM-dependent methyltransferase
MGAPEDLDPTGRFSNRADDYVRYRPSYPAAAIDALLAGLGAPESVTAVDVGAGTGISSRLLAERGVNVIAVEPNRAMREAAASHPRVSFRDGTAEALGLPSASAGLVVCAQAFHWFRADAAVREMARVLAPGGRLALVWNHRSASDPLMAGYERAILDTGASASVLAMTSDVDAVARSGAFGPRRVARFEHRQRVDRDGLLGRALSASYVPKEGPKLARLLAALDALFVQHEEHGEVALVYETEVVLAERVGE